MRTPNSQIPTGSPPPAPQRRESSPPGGPQGELCDWDFGFGVLEANACGLPVVAVAEGGFRETVQHGLNGFLVDTDPTSIADAANQLLENPTMAKQMGERGTALIKQKWNVDTSIDRLEMSFQKVIQS